MTLDEIASYCEFKDCEVTLGDPEAGFVRVNGEGVVAPYNNYRRFLQFHELGALPSPREVLEKATHFQVERGNARRELSRQEFEVELARFLKLVEAA